MIRGVEHDWDLGGVRRQADQLGQRERRVRGTAAGGDHHFTHLRGAQGRQRVVGDVGAGQLIGVGGEDARDVEGDVAVAHEDDPFVAQVDGQPGEVRVAVDPRHHLGGGRGARQSHPVDIEAPVIGRADGVEHGVVMCQQIGVAQVIADLDVEVEGQAAPSGDPVEQPRDPLGALVVGGHTGAHQAVGRGQFLEHVDPHTRLCQQFVGGIHRRRARSRRSRRSVAEPPWRTTGAGMTDASFDVGGTFSPAGRSG